MAVDGNAKKKVRYGLGKGKRPIIGNLPKKEIEEQSDSLHKDKGTQTSPQQQRAIDEKVIKVECESCKKLREQMDLKTNYDKKKFRYSPPKDLIDPYFRFSLFDNTKDTFTSYPFVRERIEELKVEVWTKEMIKAVYNSNFRDTLTQQLSTVCKRSYLSNIFEESSYVGTCFLMDIFRAVVEEDDKNTDILLCVSRQQLKLNMQDPCSPIILDFPGTEPKADSKVSPPFLVVGIMIVSYGYNLCACLPLEYKDKYITLDILCSRQGSKGIGSLLMAIMLINAHEKGYSMIGLQVASSNFKALKSKKIRRGTNVEACLFYESFGFFYDTRPRDQWFCFDPESSEMTTMMLDMEKKFGNKAELIELCKIRLSKDGAMIPEKKLVLPAPPIENKPVQPKEWNGRRVARERKRAREEVEAEPEEEQETQRPRLEEKQKIKKGDGRKIDKVLSSLKIILADGIPKSAKELLHILSSPPYSIDFIAEKPLNTLTSILSKETIHFKKTTIARVPNSLPILYTLKEFLQPKQRSKVIEEPIIEPQASPQKHRRESFSLEIPQLTSPPTIINNTISLVPHTQHSNPLLSPGTPTEPPAPLFDTFDLGSPSGIRVTTPPEVSYSGYQTTQNFDPKYSNVPPSQFKIL